MNTKFELGAELVHTQERIAELEKTIVLVRKRLSESPSMPETMLALYGKQLATLQQEVQLFALQQKIYYSESK